MIAHTYAGDAAVTTAPGSQPARIVAASISRNVAWTASSSVGYALCQWGMLVAFARLATPEALGQFAFALALSAPVMMFLQLQLRTVQVTDTRGRFGFADYFTLRVAASFAGLATVVVMAAAMGAQGSGIAIAAIVAAVKVVDGLGDILYGAWQKLERLDVPAALLIVNGAVSLAALTSALWAGVSVARAVSGSLAGSVIAFVAAAWLTRNHLHVSFVPGAGALGRIGRLTTVALPLGFVMALISLSSNIPRYFIQAWLGDRELGIFAALTYVTAAGMTLVSAVGNSLTPAMARDFDRGDRGHRPVRSSGRGAVCEAGAAGRLRRGIRTLGGCVRARHGSRNGDLHGCGRRFCHERREVLPSAGPDVRSRRRNDSRRVNGLDTLVRTSRRALRADAGCRGAVDAGRRRSAAGSPAGVGEQVSVRW
jgi:hypothetical protein